jgi:hypothetical protein
MLLRCSKVSLAIFVVEGEVGRDLRPLPILKINISINRFALEKVNNFIFSFFLPKVDYIYPY